jgi:hypothetical protein
MCHALYFS